MYAFLINRAIQSLITIFVVSIIAFTVCMILPGDPAQALLGPKGGDEKVLQHFRERLGLDKPIYVQYGKWLIAIISGNLGDSLRTGARVSTIFSQRVPVTLELLVMATIISVVIAVPTGLIAGSRPNTWIDALGTMIAVSGIATPDFLLGMVMILIFSIGLDLFPFGVYVSPVENLALNLKQIIMPAFTVGAMLAGEIMRQLRSSIIESMQSDYIQTARAKGLSEFRVIGKHALRIALIPICTLLGMRIGRLIGGIVVIEVVFALPGVGKLLMDAALFQDYPVLQTGILLVAGSVVLINFIVDVVYALIDPRIRLG